MKMETEITVLVKSTYNDLKKESFNLIILSNFFSSPYNKGSLNRLNISLNFYCKGIALLFNIKNIKIGNSSKLYPG